MGIGHCFLTSDLYSDASIFAEQLALKIHATECPVSSKGLNVCRTFSPCLQHNNYHFTFGRFRHKLYPVVY